MIQPSEKFKLIVITSVLCVLTACSASNDTGSLNKSGKGLVFASEKAASSDTMLAALEAAVNLNKKDATSWGLLAKAYYQKQQYTRAIRAGNEALSLNAKNKEAKEIIVLSSLKIAEGKIQSLNNDNNFNSDTKSQVTRELERLNKSLDGSTSLRNNK